MITFLIALAGQMIGQIPSLISWWAINLGLFIFQIMLVILFSLYVLQIDKWHTGEKQ